MTSDKPRIVTLRTVDVVPPWHEKLITHVFNENLRVIWIAAETGTAFKVVRLDGRRIDPRAFPWDVRAKSVMSIVMVNATEDHRLLAVKITVRPA